MKNRIISIIICKYLVISTAIIVVRGVLKGAGEGQVGESMYGWGYFKAFTVDSNILMAIVAGILAFYLVQNHDKEDALPGWAHTLALVGTTAVCLTMLTVIVFLAPLQAAMGHGYLFLFSGEMFFLHLFNPLLALILTAFLLKGHRYTDRECAIAVMPTLAYSVVYAIAVLVLKCWTDFYGFTFGGKNYLSPISMVAMYAATYGIATVIRLIHNKSDK